MIKKETIILGTTLVEKIFSKALGKEVKAGDFVVADIDFALAHDGTAPLAIKVFEQFEEVKVWDNKKIMFFIDHIAPSKSESISMLHNIMRNFAQKHNIKLYDVGSGICHQLMIEEGYIKPRSIIVGADSHTCTYGALGVFDAKDTIEFGICTFKKRDLVIEQLEQHVLTQELLYAIDDDFIMPVATNIIQNSKNLPDIDNLIAVQLRRGEGVIFNKNTWHWVPFPYKEKSFALVGFIMDTAKKDLEIFDLKTKIRMIE